MVKFLDLQSQYEGIRSQIDSVVLEVLRRGAFVGGEFVERFEREFASFLGATYALGVGNGTDAIELGLRGLDLPGGSEVILPVNTFFGSLEGIVNAGLKPVFVDCAEDYCIDVSKISRAITSKTSAIMPVHLYGKMCDMEAILTIAQEYGLKVIEDCAQSFGAEIEVFGEVKKAGTIGDVGCFSFYPGKNLGAYGDGGGILALDCDVYERIKSLANHGRGKDKYEHLWVGRNSRLDGIQAGVLSVKLAYINEWNARRKEVARCYTHHLQDIPCFVLPKFYEDNRNVWHLYVVRLEGENKREELMKVLNAEQIQYGIHYPHILDSQGHYQAREWSKRILSLPMGEHLGEEEVQKVVLALKKFAQSY